MVHNDRCKACDLQSPVPESEQSTGGNDVPHLDLGCCAATDDASLLCNLLAHKLALCILQHLHASVMQIIPRSNLLIMRPVSIPNNASSLHMTACRQLPCFMRHHEYEDNGMVHLASHGNYSAAEQCQT